MNNTQTNKLSTHSQLIWIILIAVLLTAVIIGGGMCVWQKTNSQSIEQTNETSQMRQSIRVYCEEFNIPNCLPIIDYSIIELDERFAVVHINGFNFLLTKVDTEWNVSIATQESDICKTGTGNTDVVTYCQQ